LLLGLQDPDPILLVFCARYRDGRIAPHSNPVKASTVSDVLSSIGQTFLRLESPDPRHDWNDKIGFRITRLIRAYQRKDQAPNGEEPASLKLVVLALTSHGNSSVAAVVLM